MEDKLGLFELMATDSAANRLYYSFSVLERIAQDQRKSSLDSLFSLLGGVVTLVNLVSYYQIPNSWPYVLAVSVVLIMLAGYYWWTSRNKGFEALEALTRFLIQLDSYRRGYRELIIANSLDPKDDEIKNVVQYLKASLSDTHKTLEAMMNNLTKDDYTTMGETEMALRSELERIERYCHQL